MTQDERARVLKIARAYADQVSRLVTEGGRREAAFRNALYARTPRVLATPALRLQWGSCLRSC